MPAGENTASTHKVVVTPGRTAVGRVPRRRRRSVPPGSTLGTTLSLPRAPRHRPLFALPLPSGPACAPRRRVRPPVVVVQCAPTTSAVASSYLTGSRLLSRRCFSPHSSSMYQRSSNGGGGGGLYPTSLQHYFTSSPELVTQQQQQQQSGTGGNIITSVAGSHMWSTGEYTQRLQSVSLGSEARQ